jgi:uncharacterized membrane protein YgdD (TMEM256/DUF423 family)
MSWTGVSGIVGFLAVALGAFGAHWLRGRVGESLLSAYQTGVLYHLVHAAALLALSLYARTTGTNITWPAALFTAGILLFSGSLYALAMTGISRLGMITPLGGLCLLAGWVAVVVQFGRS